MGTTTHAGLIYEDTGFQFNLGLLGFREYNFLGI